MKAYFFALKIAVVFTLLLAFVLAGAFRLFFHVAGDELIRELGRLRAFEGVDVAEELERLVEGGANRSVALERVREEGRERQLVMHIRSLDRGPSSEDVARRRLLHPSHDGLMKIEGRVCYLTGPPKFQAWVPLYRGGEKAAWLVVGGAPRAGPLMGEMP